MASPVQHIVRWSPQDWLTSRVRTRSIVTGKPMLRLIYREILDALYEAGGAISADPVDLQDKIAVPLADIEECLPILLEIGQRGRGGLRVEHVDGAPVLVCRRVTEEIEDDIAYRNLQSEHGRRGGRPRKATLTDERQPGENGKATLLGEKGTPSERKGTPSPPTPTPTPTPTPSPEPMPTEEAPPVGELAPSPADSTPTSGRRARPRTPRIEDSSPVVHLFPVTGDKDAPTWPLRKAKLEEYIEAFPTLDVEASTRSALQWCRDNPGRLKTAAGMARFLGQWYRGDIDSGKNLRAGPRANGNGRRPDSPFLNADGTARQGFPGTTPELLAKFNRPLRGEEVDIPDV